jgi:exopolyphosphatase/guanosine-5'-triphosphate,3'-diphosphate pyrophosphatase
VAEIAGHRLRPIVDESVFLGLGSAVVERGYLGALARGELVAALLADADRARHLGAGDVTFVGTEPIRRAADAGRIVHEVERATAAPMHVLSHEEEAFLTAIGVTEGRPVRHETLVIDVGGGSSEFCLVGPARPAMAAGLRLGSAQLTDQFVRHDPPSISEVAAMRDAALASIAAAPAWSPSEIVAVGGTASNVLKLLVATSHERAVTRDGITQALAVLAAHTAELAAGRYLIRPTRARILPAGAVILDAVLERYGVAALRVSEAGIREGTILVVDHAGAAWRDRLAALAQGWRS